MQQTRYRIQQLHRYLTSVTDFHYVSEPGVSSVMGWEGEGRGKVVVEAVDKDRVLFHESGHFYPKGGNRIDMFNCFEWRVTDRGFCLSHRRRGDAVYLFDVLPDADSERWYSEQPHVCGDDIYQGNLTVVGESIKLSWRVTGPRKDEHFHYQYRCSKA